MMDVIEEKFKNVPKVMTPDEPNIEYYQIDIENDDLFIKIRGGKYIVGSLKGILDDYVALDCTK